MFELIFVRSIVNAACPEDQEPEENRNQICICEEKKNVIYYFLNS